jgi:hypothetical protein
MISSYTDGYADSGRGRGRKRIRVISQWPDSTRSSALMFIPLLMACGLVRPPHFEMIPVWICHEPSYAPPCGLRKTMQAPPAARRLAHNLFASSRVSAPTRIW